MLALVGTAVLLPVVLCWLAVQRGRLPQISGLALSITFRCLQAIAAGGVYLALEWVAERFQTDMADLIVMPHQSESRLDSPDRLSRA